VLFGDVDKNSEYYEAIRALYGSGAIKGMGNYVFAPDKTATRADFAAILCRIDGLKATTGENYNDAGNTWFTPYLAALKQNKIFIGDSFNPNNELTYADIEMIMDEYESNGKTGTLTRAELAQLMYEKYRS
jgi:hypothetical protein